MKLCWLLPSFLGMVLFSSTAEAAKLEHWRFDANQNRLDFTTDEGIRPKAQLIANPTRLVIDLPDTRLGRPKVTQRFGAMVEAIRVGQFDRQTTRMVVELAPGYTLDPRKVRVRGESPTRWFVQLPNLQVASPARAVRERGSEPLPRAPLRTRSTSGVLQRAPMAATSATTQVENVRVTPDGFFIQTQGGIPQVRAVHSSNRKQVNIDIRGAALAYPLTGRDFSINRFGVSRLRATQFQTSPPIARVTFDLANNSADWQISVSRLGGIVVTPKRKTRLSPENQRAGSFSLVPTPSQPPQRLQSQPALTPPRPPAISVPMPPQPVSVPVPPAAPLPPSVQPSPPERQTPKARAIVVIDPGHGGPDPGAIGIGGLRETDVVLPIALEVVSLLQKQGVQAILTRADELRDVDLPPRVALAQGVKADVFVSIHANSINLSRTDISGLETYYYSNGARLARVIHNSILQEVGVRDRGVRRARFYVLRKTSMPAVLVETGFVTGAEDAPRLANPESQRQMAAAIARGILQYLNISP